MKFSPADLLQLQILNKSPSQVIDELERLKNGVDFVNLDRPCTISDGIGVLDLNDEPALDDAFQNAALEGRVTKFIPASGAASRMFQALMYCRDYPLDKDSLDRPEREFDFLRTFITGIEKFAFRQDLESALEKSGRSLQDTLANHQYTDILDHLLTSRGLDYVNCPKALIKFHDYGSHSRTSLEEHFVEAAAIVGTENACSIHVTVSPEHLDRVREHIDDILNRDSSFRVSISTQDPSTQTIAATLEHEPFRNSAGRLVFRPGGHGALLLNLNRLHGDIVFIKNVDNIAPDRLRTVNVRYKKLLGGLLIQMQTRIHHWLQRWKDLTEQDLRECLSFAADDLGINISRNASRETLFEKLNRPIRVCGMVKNQGEPGGGPFWIKDKSGHLTKQIIESSQIDLTSSSQAEILSRATHFNPVDLVCGVRNFKGDAFDLAQYSNAEACYISVKSSEGRPLRALELPGLWNGAMSNWITLFVEVPLETFNPVKTINDLLRPEHQLTVKS